MKIIAKVDENKFFCELSRNELALMVGLEHAYDIDSDDIKVGEEIDLARIIKASLWVRNLDGKHLNQTISQIKEVLAGVEKVKETAVALNLFNKLAEDQYDKV